jgi:hypothetical protein
VSINQFGRKIDVNTPQTNPYFKITPSSRMLNLDLLVPREPADPDRVVRARILMEQASTGVGEKRDPIGVVPLDNGKFRVLDGNTTLQALQDMGETEAIVEIMPIIPATAPGSPPAKSTSAVSARPLFQQVGAQKPLHFDDPAFLTL